MRLSAIVPATDKPVQLERVVSAIRAADDAPDDVIIVDEAPQAGPAAARNLGAARAAGDVLVFVDSDVVPHTDAFQRIRAAFAAEPELAAIFGSYDDAPPETGAVSGFRNLLHHYIHQQSPGEASTFWAGLGAIRREVFLAAGGFDAERYPRASIEDIELGLRLARGGVRMRLDPALQGTHLKRWTLGTMIRTDLRARGVPWVALLAREQASPSGLNLGWRHRLSAAASIGLVASLAGRRHRQAALALGTLVVLNAPFYRLLLQRRGPAQAIAGVGLHALHHLTGAAAVPLGLLEHARERR
ncbi:MAG: glycosyltransferase family 2 protein [Gaiellaceae bacterium]